MIAERRPTVAEMKRMPKAAPCPACESEAIEAWSTGDDHMVRCFDCGIALHGRKFPTVHLDKHTRKLAKAIKMYWLDAAEREAQVMLLIRWNALPREES